MGMKKNATSGILEEYDQQCDLYSDFTASLKKLLEDILREKKVHVHSVTSRLKTRSNLSKKLTHAEGKYVKIDDVPDISGLRITTYFVDDVDSIADMIKKEFDVDMSQSVDKRELLDPDRFGYVSLHYVVKLSTSRLKLTEYKRFVPCHAEIQVRSILQHAWAEIEHDLGYKSARGVPRDFRRRFSRLAGLLEIADAEFVQIRNGLQEYEQSVPRLITRTPELVLIDESSLTSYIKGSPVVRNLDDAINSAGIFKVQEQMSNIDGSVQNLHYVGVDTIAELDSLLQEEKDVIVKFARLWVDYARSKRESADRIAGRGICIFYLCYIQVGKKKSITDAYEYMETMRIGFEDERKSDAEAIVRLYSEAIK